MPLRRRLDSAALRFTRNKQDAEDLVQDNMITRMPGSEPSPTVRTRWHERPALLGGPDRQQICLRQLNINGAARY
jgi:hypothetical protein